MSRRTTAADRLQRILDVLPEAARLGSVPRERLSRMLGIDVTDLLDDLREVSERAFYLPPEDGAEIQVVFEGDRIHVWTTGPFSRPVRLTPAEGLALVIGLRSLSIATAHGREERLALARSLEERLGRGKTERIDDQVVAIDEGSDTDEAIRAALEQAARDQQPCRLRYVKPGEPPEERTLEPYAVVYAAADGAWYVLGRSAERDDVRAFRLDRVLAVEELDGSFEVPDGFDAADYLTGGGRLYRAEEEVEAVVRYSPNIARWIEEVWECTKAKDGSVLVRHRVADPGWLVRHVLLHAPEAEVVEPAELRERVREVAEGVESAAPLNSQIGSRAPTPKSSRIDDRG